MPFVMFCLGTQNTYQSSSLTFPGERISCCLILSYISWRNSVIKKNKDESLMPFWNRSHCPLGAQNSSFFFCWCHYSLIWYSLSPYPGHLSTWNFYDSVSPFCKLSVTETESALSNSFNTATPNFTEQQERWRWSRGQRHIQRHHSVTIIFLSVACDEK